MRTRREVLAAWLAWTTGAEGGRPPPRLRTTTGWRDVGGKAAALAGVLGTPVEERLHVALPPWTDCSGFTFRLDVRRSVHGDVRPAAAERHLATLLDGAI